MRYFYTYFDRNYMERGLALYASLQRHCGEFHLDILCLDDECQKSLLQLSMPECRLISLPDIETADQDLAATRKSRTTVEYYFTITPCLAWHLLRKIPAGEFLTYLDSDLYFYSDPEPLFEELRTGSIGIISHRFPKEFDYLNRHGTYNVGWVSFRNDDQGQACVKWWRECCLEWCYNRAENSLYADQAYLNDWPHRFKSTVVIQHLGANVAPWNVGQYRVAKENSTVTIDGQALIFYHFHALRRIKGRLFDSQLSKYGIGLTGELRRHIYQPYLDELDLAERKLPGGSRLPADQASSGSNFDLIPRHRDPLAEDSMEQVEIENYLHQNLIFAEKDRCAKQAYILLLERECQMLKKVCDEREAMIEDLNIKITMLRRRTILRTIRIKLSRKLVKSHWMKLGVLRQYEPLEMRREKFPKSALPDRALPSIEIVTPSFMQGHFLERTMQSVLSQEYPKLRYIVQDGGSHDDSVEVIKRHATKLAAWESTPDHGQSDAIKRGFKKCEADIMAWLNSDDMLMPGALRYLGEYFAAHPEVDVIYGHRVVIDENDREVGRWILPPHNSQMLKWADYVPQETLFWRHNLWEKVGGVDTSFRFALDWDLLVRFVNAGARIVRLPYFLGCFRTHAAQKTLAEMVNSHGEEEMARIRKSIHGRRISDLEVAPRVEGFLLHGTKTACLLAMGIRL